MVTWKHRRKKSVAVRQVAGRTEKGLATPTAVSTSSIRPQHSVHQLQHICSDVQTVTPQPPPLCGCDNKCECGGTKPPPICGCGIDPASVCGCGIVGCSECGTQQSIVIVGRPLPSGHSMSSIPVTSNSAYQVKPPSEVELGTNPAYTSSQGPLSAPPPPPYPGPTSKVKSVHEYDYIATKN